ncbi:MAG: hypothetical protein ACP5QU_09055, partial [Anaerolineae bacterium]
MRQNIFSPRFGWLRFVFSSVIILILLAGQNAFGGSPSPVQAAPAGRPLANTPPAVSLNVPATAFIGSTVNFTVTFDNPDPSDPGYGPIIDLIIPTNGADGAPNPDGLTFVSATYLGVSVEKTLILVPGSGCITHPYIKNSSGA